MKKRILAVLLCTSLTVAALAGCKGNQENKGSEKEEKVLSAEDQLDEVLTKMQKDSAGNMDMTINMTMDMNYGDQSMKVPIRMDVKAKNADSEDIMMAMNMDMEVAGQKAVMTTYYTDGYYYMDMNGSKIKYPMDLNTIKQQLDSVSGYQRFSTDMFTKVDVKEVNGHQEYTVEGDTEKMEGSLNQIVDMVKQTLGTDATYQFSDIKGKIVAENKDIKELDMSYTMSVEMQGQTVKANVESSSIINSMGEEVNITLPNLDEYQETSASGQTAE